MHLAVTQVRKNYWIADILRTGLYIYSDFSYNSKSSSIKDITSPAQYTSSFE